jgi:hypothetical protein
MEKAHVETQSKLSHIEKQLSRFEERSQAAWKNLELKLDRIAGGAGVDAYVSTERSDVVDRKRLKERLKEATAVRAASTTNRKTEGRSSFLEKVFGIREADSRAGKERSRYLTQ